jgi:hypothetical protein
LVGPEATNSMMNRGTSEPIIRSKSEKMAGKLKIQDTHSSKIIMTRVRTIRWVRYIP